MRSGRDPLVFPPHFPPTTRWRRFFIGVRRLGPDLSFFAELKEQQGSRTQAQMAVWGSGSRRGMAEFLSFCFKEEVGWRTAVFLPDDSFQVMCNGPAFGIIDDLGSMAVVRRSEKHYGIRIPNSFWAGREKHTFGQIVDALTVNRGGGAAVGTSWSVTSEEPPQLPERQVLYADYRPAFKSIHCAGDGFDLETSAGVMHISATELVPLRKKPLELAGS